MNFVKKIWHKEDGEEFVKYLEGLKNPDKVEWSRNILNTNMPVLAIKTKVLRDILKEISYGNFMSFIDLNLNNYYENSSINGSLICKIDDVELMRKYLDKYVLSIDNWALCDILSFNIKGREKFFYELALEYTNSDKPFTRRVGFVILFNFIDNDEYIDKIFSIMNGFYNENHYYVNMINAWLFCECFIKRRDKTIEFLKNHKLNKFTINKGISKCRDSFRVSDTDKEMLLKYRVK